MVVFPPPLPQTDGLNPLNLLDPRGPVHEEYNLEYPRTERTRARRDYSESYSTNTDTSVEDDRRDDINPGRRRAGKETIYPEPRGLSTPKVIKG